MKKQERIVSLVSVLVILLASAGSLLAQTSADKKAQFEDVFAQGERLYSSGNFRGAVERYFFASKLAQEPADYSRVYFGLSLSYYYLNDAAECEKYIRHVLEVDPHKAVSVAIYPLGYVQTFERIRAELKIPAPAASEPEQVQPPFQPAAQQPPVETKAQPVVAQPETKPAPATTNAPQAAAAAPEVPERPGGHFAVTALVSSWSVNLIKGLFESSVDNDFSTEIRRVMTTDLRDVYHHFNLVPVSSGFENNLAFSSSGPNYGLELRYYSRGWGGLFSFGLSFEETRLKLAITGTVKQSYTDGSSASATVEGSAEANIFSTNLSFRWDILPTSRVCPYFILGLGWAPFKVNITETYTGTFVRGSTSENISGTQVKALEDIASQNDFNIPDAILIVHAGFGLKVGIAYGIEALAEASVWDGFLLRFGVGYRF